MPFDAALLVEDTPRISMGAVRRAGVLVAAGPVVIDVEASDQSIRAERHGSTIRFEWSDGEQTVDIEFGRLKFGAVTYFSRPDGQGRCTTLYLAEGRLLNREALRLAYTSQRMTPGEREELGLRKIVDRLNGNGDRGPARGALKARLLESLRDRGAHLPDEAWAHLDKQEEDRRKSRRRRPLGSDPPMSMRWALLRGRTAKSRVPSAEIVTMLAKPLEPPRVQVASIGLGALDAAPRPVRDAPEIDIRALAKKRGYARGHQMAWREGKARISALACIIGDDEPSALRLDIWSAAVGTYVARQDVQIVGGKRQGDLFLICPVSGRRVRKIYFRANRFASAEAQRLHRRNSAPASGR